MWRALAVVWVLAGAGCPAAPTTLELEPSPRTVEVGPVACSIRLPRGSELQQATKASTRFMIPGRGGAMVHLSLTTTTLDLAAKVTQVENGHNINGSPPVVVRKETVGGRDFITTRDVKGWFISADSWTAVPSAAAGPQQTLLCHANIGRSSAIADPEQTRKTLEAICESVALTKR